MKLNNVPKAVFFIGLIFIFMTSCKTSPAIKSTENSTTTDILRISKSFAETIDAFFEKTASDKKNTLVALLMTKNDTVDDIPVDLLDSALVKELLARDIFTVRTEDRGLALNELQFQLAGFAEGNLETAQMKTPDYFIKVKIDENRYRAKKKTRNIERAFFMELRSVQTQIVLTTAIEIQNLQQKFKR